MKMITLLITVIMFSVQGFAADMPEYMKDGTITVTLKDGKTYKFSTNEYKVVKRESAKEETATVKETKVAKGPVSKQEKQADKYRLTLLAGYGYTGKLKETSSPSTVNVEQEQGLIGGLAGQVDVSKDVHLMGIIQTNQSFLLGIGKGF